MNSDQVEFYIASVARGSRKILDKFSFIETLVRSGGALYFKAAPKKSQTVRLVSDSRVKSQSVSSSITTALEKAGKTSRSSFPSPGGNQPTL